MWTSCRHAGSAAAGSYSLRWNNGTGMSILASGLMLIAYSVQSAEQGTSSYVAAFAVIRSALGGPT
jgi:hypothetical protein